MRERPLTRRRMAATLSRGARAGLLRGARRAGFSPSGEEGRHRVVNGRILTVISFSRGEKVAEVRGRMRVRLPVLRSERAANNRPMRILVVGPQFADSFARNICVTLQGMGHKVQPKAERTLTTTEIDIGMLFGEACTEGSLPWKAGPSMR